MDAPPLLAVVTQTQTTIEAARPPPCGRAGRKRPWAARR
jgi:hypothetical protein